MRLEQTQKGVLVLGLSLVILLVMGIFALMLELHGVQRLKMTLINYQAEQAFNAAEAGLNYGVAYVIQSPPKNAFTKAVNISTTSINQQLGEHVGQVAALTVTGGSLNEYKLTSTGQSQDGLASKTIEHVIYVSPQNPNDSGYKLTGWKDY